MAKQRFELFGKVEQGSVSLVAGTSSCAADSAALEIVDAFIRTDANDTEKQIDTKLRRISRVEYNHQAKNLISLNLLSIM